MTISWKMFASTKIIGSLFVFCGLLSLNATADRHKIKSAQITQNDQVYTIYYKLDGILFKEAEIFASEHSAAINPKPVGSFVVPNQIDGNVVTKIGDSAFRNCSDLESVIIPEKVTEIGDFAFASCTKLKNVTFSADLREIEEGAFSGCVALEAIIIPNKVKEIGEKAFQNCAKLSSVNLGNNVRDIDDRAFSGCSMLEIIVVPNSVRELNDFVFSDCSKLTTATIGENVREIGDGLFRNCVSLQKVYFHGNYPKEAGHEIYAGANASLKTYVTAKAKGWDKNIDGTFMSFKGKPVEIFEVK